MSEMLANQYYLSRKFDKAEIEYENALSGSQHDIFIYKKLMICYTQTNKLTRAVDLLKMFSIKDLRIISETDIENEDCPCHELITKIDEDEEMSDSAEGKLSLAIFWLCCDLGKSQKYFEDYQIKKNDNRIDYILKKINNILLENKQPEEK